MKYVENSVYAFHEDVREFRNKSVLPKGVKEIKTLKAVNVNGANHIFTNF